MDIDSSDRFIFIPGNIPSSKNSKVATEHGVFHSKTVMKWLRAIGIQNYSTSKKYIKGYKDALRPNNFNALTDAFLKQSKDKTKPIFVGFHFIRDSRRKYDFQNAIQILMDLMVAHDWIDDDDTSNIYPIPLYFNGGWQTISKDNAGCLMCVFDDNEVELLKSICNG